MIPKKITTAIMNSNTSWPFITINILRGIILLMKRKLTASGCRSKTKSFVLLPILFLVISVSGCTGFESIPFIGSFCIPGLTCAQVVQYENDVLVIKTLEALPSTISTGQQILLSAWIQNNGGETVPQTSFTSPQPVKVLLYDTCEGLFDNIVVTCPTPPDGKPTATGYGCEIKSILPKQTIPISWTLRAKDAKAIPLETSCSLKVYVQYPYETKSITSTTFVDYVEYQRMLNENKYSAITSYITEGYGPIKPYLTVETTQPIPVENKVYQTEKPTFQIGFQIKNQGSGFLSVLDQATGVKIKNDDIKIQSNTGLIGTTTKTYDLGCLVSVKINGKTNRGSCTSTTSPTTDKGIGDVQLIGKESPKQIFPIVSPYENKIEKVATYYVTTAISYMYEFRKEIKVTIKPPPITT